MTNKTETLSYTVKVELVKTIFEFSNSERPTISDYNTLYADIYGQYPNVRCIINITENNRSQRQQDPQFTYVDGKLDTVYFDFFGDPQSGYLVLS
jgi:hypothetical protein